MSRTSSFVLAAIFLLAAAAGAYYWWSRREPAPLPAPPARVEAPAPAAPQGPRHPVPEAAPRALPPLAASDPALLDALRPLFGAAALERLFNLDEAIRRIVATIDNLPREQVSARLNPVRPVGGLPATQGRDASLALAPDNAKRYAAQMRALELVDARALAGVYLHFHPLFQQAYVELGYPNGHFNDRLVEVIDHLLAAPEVKGPIKLAQPKVLYEFADERLEALSAGQKAMVRIGPENAARVKAKLREIRMHVARGPA